MTVLVFERHLTDLLDAVLDGVAGGPRDAQVTTYPAADLAEMVLPNAGTRYPNAEEVMLLGDIADAL